MNLGLKRGDLLGGFRVTEIVDIVNRNPRSRLQGNVYFRGNGMGLPNGGPEIVVDSIPTWPWP